MAAMRGTPAGIVFRRLDGGADRRRAGRLLPPGCRLDHDDRCVWYGLCDLTAADAEGLAGVAVVRPLDAATVQLCGLAVSSGYRGRGLGRRLLDEVTDRLRASGVEQMLAPPVHDHSLGALLAQVGFVAPGQPPRSAPGWSLLVL